MLFVVLGLLLLAVLAVGFWLWCREARRAGRRRSWSGLGMPLLVVVLAAFGYLLFGYNPNTPRWLADQQHYGPMAEQIIHGRTPEQGGKDFSAEALTRVLQAKLVNQPSGPGWFALGVLYDQLGSPRRAEQAARRAIAMAPSNLSARLLLARALIEQADGKLTDPAYAQIREVLAQNPRHDGALMLLAMSAGQARRYGLAVDAWSRLLQRHDQGETGALIRKGLARARQQQTLAEKLDGLKVEVRGGGLPDGGTLFVFLHEKGQGGQPLAAKRVLVSHFPTTVTLHGSDWLQSYPSDPGDLRVAARYTPAPGSKVDAAGIRSAAVPLSLSRDPAATLTLGPDASTERASGGAR